MKMLKISTLCAAVLAMVASAHAITAPVNVTVSGGVDVWAAPNSDIANYGSSTVANYIFNDVTSYNSINSTTLPDPFDVGLVGLSQGANGTQVGGSSITLDLTGANSYVFFHWGGQGGGWEQIFYVGGLVGDYTFDNTLIGTGHGPSVGGLSFYSYYGGTTVPDGGSTVLMLGAALSGLSLVVRRFKK